MLLQKQQQTNLTEDSTDTIQCHEKHNEKKDILVEFNIPNTFQHQNNWTTVSCRISQPFTI